ncbi:MAG: SagB/ThcOx family dehydrogenase [Thermodesulfovibrionales bacterium]|nr:SagB/ThcOx family dehydrogenase [Thermodesulfovibrionales bacterium]
MSIFYNLLFLSVSFIFCTSSIAYCETIGERFHRETKHTRVQVLKDLIAPKPPKPSDFKEYTNKPKIKLPPADFRGISFEDALLKRRSIREYSKGAITLRELSQLLFSAQGITGKIYGTYLRTAPSAGALYPFEIYVIANNVEQLKQGIYHYSVRDHSIVLLKEGDFKKDLLKASIDQEMVRDAGVVFLLSAIFDRTRSKYGERGYRYVYMEAGHISQNLYLQATSIGLGSTVIGAFFDDDINRLIDVDGKKEAVIAVQTVGKL